MELFSIFSRFLQNVVVFCFSESIFQKTTQQSDGGCNVTSDSNFNAKCSKKQTFLSSSANKKPIVSKEYCISHHDAGMWFLPICIKDRLLLGVVEELLHKLDPLCFAYQHVDCLFTLYKYPLNRNIAVKSGEVFDNLQGVVCFNQRNRVVDRISSIAKNRPLRT